MFKKHVIRMLKIENMQNHRRQEINIFQINRKKLKLKETSDNLCNAHDARLGDFNAR